MLPPARVASLRPTPWIFSPPRSQWCGARRGKLLIPWLNAHPADRRNHQLSGDSGGMLPIFDACRRACKRGVGRVRILPASQSRSSARRFLFRESRAWHGVLVAYLAVQRQSRIVRYCSQTYDRHLVILTRRKGRLNASGTKGEALPRVLSGDRRQFARSRDIRLYSRQSSASPAA